MPSDVTDDMLENVIDDFVSNKVYDQGPKGSTCHQKAKKTQVHGYHGKKKTKKRVQVIKFILFCSLSPKGPDKFHFVYIRRSSVRFCFYFSSFLRKN